MESFFTNLSHKDLIAVAGKDSEIFLQGQLTCDLNALKSTDSCPGCLCDLKGRVIASFDLWKMDGSFYLEMAAGLGEIVLAQLGKYAVFYKTEMSVCSKFPTRLGLSGKAAEELLSNLSTELPAEKNQIVSIASGAWLRMIDTGQHRYELWLEQGKEQPLDETVRQSMPEGQSNDWLLLDQELGLYRLQAEASGMYTPQELNYDLLGYISFNKGCYTGQEIVARMHYRGKAKKRLYRLGIQSGEPLSVHSQICTQAGQSIGEIISVALLPDGNYRALAIANELIMENRILEQNPNASIDLIS